jgi:hypothetical protein
MKNLILAIAFIVVSFTYSQAKDQTVNPEGFWVVESNVKSTCVNTIKFYDDNHKLLYQETVYEKVNVKSKKVQKILNQLLAVLVNEKPAQQDVSLLASVL